VLADRYDGKRLNSPNDLVLDSKGGIYFTDPRYGDRGDMEMEIEGVYYRPKRGKLLRVIDDLQRPNGLTLSLDKKVLYVADNAAKTIWSYVVKPDGSVTDGKLFAQLDLESRGGGDGMSIDRRGNVYCAAQGHIWIWNPKGQQVAKIAVPENPSNCAFGGKDLKTLYITARTGLYRIRLNVAGARPY
jgi:gluconolactonase